MNKSRTADNTLTELWAVKDETAARFKSAADYLAHLGLRAPLRTAQSGNREGGRSHTSRSEQASPKRSRLVRAIA